MSEAAKDVRWEIAVTVLIPREEAATSDEAMQLLGKRLKPWAWSGQMPMDTIKP